MTSQLECSIFRVWNVWGGTLQFLGMSTDKMFTRCKFSMKRQKTDDQKASVYHVATASVRFRIWYNHWKYFKNILKYFSTLWNTIRWPFYKPGKIFRCFKQVINTYLVAASIRTAEKTQFHFVINMRKILSQNNFVMNFVILCTEIVLASEWVGRGLLCKPCWKCQKV